MQISPDGQLAPTPVLTKHARDQYEASLPETNRGQDAHSAQEARLPVTLISAPQAQPTDSMTTKP